MNESNGGRPKWGDGPDVVLSPPHKPEARNGADVRGTGSSPASLTIHALLLFEDESALLAEGRMGGGE